MSNCSRVHNLGPASGGHARGRGDADGSTQRHLSSDDMNKHPNLRSQGRVS